MLKESDLATRLPARDLSRARKFYSEKLGLDPVEQRPGGLRYRSGNSFFVLFASAGEASGSHTHLGWQVADIEATVAALKARGVVFEEYDLPGLKTVDGSPKSQEIMPARESVREARGSKTAGAISLALVKPFAEVFRLIGPRSIRHSRSWNRLG